MGVKRPTYTEIPRDAKGRPLIIHPTTGDLVPYERPSQAGGMLLDDEFLREWRERMILLGVADDDGHDAFSGKGGLKRPGSSSPLLREIRQAKSDRVQLNLLAHEAFDRGGGNEKSGYGTRFHERTEEYDLGQPVGEMSAEMAADFDAYRKLTAGWRYQSVEPFIVNDTLGFAGSADRFLTSGVGIDLKTGAKIQASALEYVVQFAIYATGEYYDFRTGERTPIANVRRDIFYAVWVAKGTGVARLMEADIRIGYEGAQLAKSIFDWRKRTGVMKQVMTTDGGRRSSIEGYWRARLLTQCHTPDDLVSVWREAQQKKEWTPGLTALAAELRGTLDSAALPAFVADELQLRQKRTPTWV